MKDNDGYMTIKTDYRIIYIGKLSYVIFNLLAAFIWMGKTIEVNNCLELSC